MFPLKGALVELLVGENKGTITTLDRYLSSGIKCVDVKPEERENRVQVWSPKIGGWYTREQFVVLYEE